MKIIWYDSWNTRCDRQTFLSFWAFFFPFHPLTTWKIKFFTFKKTPGHIIILYICTTNDNHMMYGSWDMEHIRQLLVILDHFLPLYSPNNPKNQNVEKMKKRLEILSLYTCVPWMTVIWCTVPEIWSMTDITFCQFGRFFAHLCPQQLEKSKFWKNEKNTWNISSFYNSVLKIMIICYTVPEIWHMTDVITFRFLGHFWPFYPPNSPKNQN